MAICIHVSCLTHQHDQLDLDPTYKGAYGLPLLRMTFDWHGNDPRKMRNMDKRRTDIGRALNGSGLGRENTGTRSGITGYQSTHNVGSAVMGSDPSTSDVNKYPRSWDVSNPFVVGGSAFPRNPRPTHRDNRYAGLLGGRCDQGKLRPQPRFFGLNSDAGRALAWKPPHRYAVSAW
jgi:hypothetical protein